MFGWSFRSWGDEAYRLVLTGEGPGIDGGMVRRRGAPPVGGEPLGSWVCTVDVEDVDAYVARAQALSGQVAVPKMAVPGVGWLAYVQDTEGNILGLMQADAAAV